MTNTISSINFGVRKSFSAEAFNDRKTKIDEAIKTASAPTFVNRDGTSFNPVAAMTQSIGSALMTKFTCAAEDLCKQLAAYDFTRSKDVSINEKIVDCIADYSLMAEATEHGKVVAEVLDLISFDLSMADFVNEYDRKHGEAFKVLICLVACITTCFDDIEAGITALRDGSVARPQLVAKAINAAILASFQKITNFK